MKSERVTQLFANSASMYRSTNWFSMLWMDANRASGSRLLGATARLLQRQDSALAAR